MRIGELAKRSGLSRDTIRFYEKQGLIAVAGKPNKHNTYKDYPQSTLERLVQIQRIKGFGFTLAETSTMLEMIESQQASCTHVSEKVSEKVALIDLKITELQVLRQLMLGGVEKCQTCCPPQTENENCPIFTTEQFTTEQFASESA
ncbi:heavy metal-responsive transcriptional regulator [Xanthocytophaga flava]|uniref:heavy metal-responsive transcriptional regulator n=1 Tax=Xanthocytophaga flava TaxID=3048013 RepID=UPI0028D0E936|nr:heavy metal-responsive transcriptional regulator [Xanthocytophaga flavus]MDJ1470176.1 heavy metal-responsive transcriptional regulator [Xanthocytophaga flavus]